MNKIAKFTLVATPVVMCAGCALIGPNADPEAQKKIVEVGGAVVNAVAGVTGQAWAIPLVSAIAAALVGAINLHHGVRNVTLGAGKILASTVVKAFSPRV